MIVLASLYCTVQARGNFQAVVPQRVYRSAQPTARQLRTWISRYGLKTIVNLRGPNARLATEEKAVATAMGADAVYLELSAYHLVPSHKLVQLIEILETAAEPILIHCHAGVDRTGVASALAAWLLGGQPYDRAKWQAYVPPGPWKRKDGPDHISDTLALYGDYCREHGFNPDAPSRFKYWAANVYHPHYYFVELGAPREFRAAPGEFIAIPVRITNRSAEVIPATDPHKSFRVYTQLAGVSAKDASDGLLYATTLWPLRDLPPGESMQVIHTVEAPSEPGEYRFLLDVEEVGRTTFSDQGSPSLDCDLVVGSPMDEHPPDGDGPNLAAIRSCCCGQCLP